MGRPIARHLTDDEKKAMVALVLQGGTQKQVATMLDCTLDIARRFLRESGVSTERSGQNEDGGPRAKKFREYATGDRAYKPRHVGDPLLDKLWDIYPNGYGGDDT